jgi:cytochrome d ubiquinol oxidase subunit I
MKTKDAFSATLSAGEVIFSLILFAIVYCALGVLYVYLLIKEMNHGPEPAKEVAA